MTLYFVPMDKLEQLRGVLRSYGSCLVAYSGGVDSVFLARVAHNALGDKALAVIADSPSLPRRELAEALELGQRFSFPVRVVKTAEFENPSYLANPNNRCYFCKHELFEELAPLARAEGFAVIAYGENASDVGDFRPGAQAAKEFQVRAPLKEVGLTKAEIRELSAKLGLPTADKPQMACLSSRIPYGEAVTEGKLRMIEAAEYVLRDLGFYDVRVRHHELNPKSEIRNPKAEDRNPKAEGPKGEHSTFNIQHSTSNGQGGKIPKDPNTQNGTDGTDGKTFNIQHSTANVQAPALARIEVGPAELPRLLVSETSGKVAAALKEIGYAHVTVDLQGYRRGSLNEAPGAKLPMVEKGD